LEFVVDQIEGCKGFPPANWNDRSLVEMTGEKKGYGWFLHALTGDEWLLTLKFRVPRKTFVEDALRRRLDLQSFDDIDDLPVYGRSERVRVRNLKGPWQEVTITVHWLREIDTPEFRDFLEEARAAFLNHLNRAKLNIDDLTPWKVLGRKWHTSRKGFLSGKRIRWEPGVAEGLFDALAAALPGCEIDWGNKQVVYFRHPGLAAGPTGRGSSNGNGKIWAAVHTKRRGGVDLSLFAAPGNIALGQITDFGSDREIATTRTGRQIAKIRFCKSSQVHSQALAAFLKKCAAD
jgi:excinuclease ABC subunit A